MVYVMSLNNDCFLTIQETFLFDFCLDNRVLFFQGCVYVKCSNMKTAGKAFQALHGWWFDRKYWTSTFHEVFMKM